MRAQFGIRGIKMFLDGIPLTFPDGQSQLNNLNVDELRNIEILKGPSSVLYGNSLGGSILFSSKDNFVKPLTLSAKLTLGNFELKKISFNSNFYLDSTNSVSLGAYHTSSDGFREHSKSKYYAININSKLYPSEKSKISIIANYYNSPYLLNPSSLNKSDSENNPTKVRTSILNFASAKKLQQLQTGIDFEYRPTELSSVSATIYSVIRDLDNSIPGRIIQLKKNFYGLRLEYGNEFKLLGTNIMSLSGVDYEIQFDDRSEYENLGVASPQSIDPMTLFDQLIFGDNFIQQNENVYSIGMFSHFNIHLSNKSNLFFGLRYDDFLFDVKSKIITENTGTNITMNNLSTMLGINYKFLPALTLHGNISNGFQTPTANELSNNPFGEGGFNTSLKPENVMNIEFGIKSWLETVKLLSQISLYKMFFTNLLIGYQTESEETFFRNAGKAENLGLEAKFEWLPINYLNITSAYTFTNFVFTDYIVQEEIDGTTKSFQLENNYLPGIPKHTYSISIAAKIFNSFHNQISIQWIDDYFANDFNGPIVRDSQPISNFINDAYFKLNFSSSYVINLHNYKVKLLLDIENIFNQRYNGSIVPNAFFNNFFEPAPGRIIYFGFSLTY